MEGRGEGGEDRGASVAAGNGSANSRVIGAASAVGCRVSGTVMSNQLAAARCPPTAIAASVTRCAVPCEASGRDRATRGTMRIGRMVGAQWSRQHPRRGHPAATSGRPPAWRGDRTRFGTVCRESFGDGFHPSIGNIYECESLSFAALNLSSRSCHQLAFPALASVQGRTRRSGGSFPLPTVPKVVRLADSANAARAGTAVWRRVDPQVARARLPDDVSAQPAALNPSRQKAPCRS